jgi:hypothetical protein
VLVCFPGQQQLVHFLADLLGVHPNERRFGVPTSFAQSGYDRIAPGINGFPAAAGRIWRPPAADRPARAAPQLRRGPRRPDLGVTLNG